ncbi:conserved hypothetical protein [Verticillium alfalfae VaMs.102]|uniref:protein-ribulosamine 3-kinase n=1 Tax=Verticillium alfalfae (strain VaMs.102 / ATCC MYA-4576 / FGSC 10136) TaxID=526221 RepID=C9S692_VERA1|nr:conserved hypothetical protein [Verticillium alfalfae VaMs.102]EEY14404.1 conserved hypothetical protein [Verticillium alfalfae VaMs.102]
MVRPSRPSGASTPSFYRVSVAVDQQTENSPAHPPPAIRPTRRYHRQQCCSSWHEPLDPDRQACSRVSRPPSAVFPEGRIARPRPASCLLLGPVASQTSSLIVLQTVRGDRGRKVVSGEYRSMTAIHVVMPSLVPKPIAWGSCEDEPDLHFFLSEFRSMTEGLPAIDAFSQRVAQLHRSATSPDGRFGFFEPTCHGHTPIDHGWHETWEAYFASTTRRLFHWEQAAQGPNHDILNLMGPFFSNVIPRLLRPLETDGRSITPSLIHGDLWHGNVATDADTQEPVIFDAASSYAHNEYELGVWRQPWNELGAAYRARYHEIFPPSSPVEDCDDRNALYATRVHILDSILYRDDDEYRKMCVPPETW